MVQMNIKTQSSRFNIEQNILIVQLIFLDIS